LGQGLKKSKRIKEMDAANVDANGFMFGGQVLNMPCGNLAGDGPNKTHNPIPLSRLALSVKRLDKA
jgi:hypothetical protein